MTLIKDKLTGEWVQTAGGHRTWMGTRAQLESDIASDDIPSDAVVTAIVTDEPSIGYVQNGVYNPIAGSKTYKVDPGVSVDIDTTGAKSVSLMGGTGWTESYTNFHPEITYPVDYFRGKSEINGWVDIGIGSGAEGVQIFSGTWSGNIGRLQMTTDKFAAVWVRVNY